MAPWATHATPPGEHDRRSLDQVIERCAGLDVHRTLAAGAYRVAHPVAKALEDLLVDLADAPMAPAKALFDRGHFVGPPRAPDPTLLRWLLPRYLHDRPRVRQLATDCPDARTESCQALASSVVYSDCRGFALKPRPRRPQGKVGPLIRDEPQARAAEFNSAFDYCERRGVSGTQSRKEDRARTRLDGAR